MMKKRSTMQYFTLSGIAFTSLMLLSSCFQGEKKQDNHIVTGITNLPTEVSLPDEPAAPTAVLNGNTLTYGDHSYTFTDGLTLQNGLPAKTAGQKATLTFTHFPATVDEFKALQAQLMGKSMAGALALNILAYEMFRRDRAVGEECLKLCNIDVNASETIGMLRQKLSTNRYDPNDNDTYHQPFLAASFLDGATQDSKYQPNYPYVMSFTWNTNPNIKQHERSNTYYGYIYHLNVVRNGKPTDASVLVPDEEELVLAHNTPNYYVMLPDIKTWEDTLK